MQTLGPPKHRREQQDQDGTGRQNLFCLKPDQGSLQNAECMYVLNQKKLNGAFQIHVQQQEQPAVVRKYTHWFLGEASDSKGAQGSGVFSMIVLSKELPKIPYQLPGRREAS